PLREGLLRQRVPEPCVLVIFGATGDLAHRKLMPAIYSLAHEGLLPPHFSIVGCSLPEMTDAAFRDDMKKAVLEFSRYKPVNEAVWNSLAEGIFYVSGDFKDLNTFGKLKAVIEKSDRERGTLGNRLFYLSTAPSQFEILTTKLKESGLSRGPGWQ